MGECQYSEYTEIRCLHMWTPHAAGPRIPAYYSTDADENRISKTQSQRCTKAACLQKILKLSLGEAKRKTL